MKTRVIAIILSAIGFVDSIYLLFIKYSQNESLCFVGAGDCLSVNNSIYSEIFGLPIAGLGAATYAVILVLLFLETRKSAFTQWSGYILFGITFFGLIYSAYLTYLEIAVIKAVCPFCVVSAVIILILFVISIIRLFHTTTD